MHNPTIFDKALLEQGLECNAAHLLSRPFFFEAGARIGSRHTAHTCFVGKGCRIGRYSYVNGGIIRPDTTIGRYTSIGHNVTLGAPEHRISRLSTHPLAASCPKPSAPSGYPSGALPSGKHVGPTHIGSDVWLGDGVVVLAGKVIGHGAVVGANAVVTTDIPPYAVAVGVPARVIKLRFSEETVSRLLHRKWFNLPHEAVVTLQMDDIGWCLSQLDDIPTHQFSDATEYLSA